MKAVSDGKPGVMSLLEVVDLLANVRHRVQQIQSIAFGCEVPGELVDRHDLARMCAVIGEIAATVESDLKATHDAIGEARSKEPENRERDDPRDVERPAETNVVTFIHAS